MEEEDTTPRINFISCVKWVKRGVAKEKPDKVELSKEELQEIIDQTKAEVAELSEESGDENQSHNRENDEYNFDEYDNADASADALMGIGNLALYASNDADPYVTRNEDSDSEKEDDLILPTDNLILVGHVEGDASILEVYVCNREGTLYVHHDLLLPAVPLCLEWVNYDPGESKPGNLCAMGSMSPVIELWDLDVVDCLEPVNKLGHRGSKKKKIPKYGHRDAVLDISWNALLPHVLASGSADSTVLLWDLQTLKYGDKISVFKEKVQTIKWHPFECQTLLTGSCDKTVRLFDCRDVTQHKHWEVNGEVEHVNWNHFKPYNFFVGTSTGKVYYFDSRSTKAVWEFDAHEKEVTGVSLSSQCPGLLLTAGADGCLKTWDVDANPTLVWNTEPPVGRILCLDACPDLPFIACLGGDNRSNNFRVIDVSNNAAVQQRFSKRQLVATTTSETEGAATETMNINE